MVFLKTVLTPCRGKWCGSVTARVKPNSEPELFRGYFFSKNNENVFLTKGNFLWENYIFINITHFEKEKGEGSIQKDIYFNVSDNTHTKKIQVFVKMSCQKWLCLSPLFQSCADMPTVTYIIHKIRAFSVTLPPSWENNLNIIFFSFLVC